MTEATEAPAEAEGEGPTGSLAAPGGDKEDLAAAQGEASGAISAARPARQALIIFLKKEDHLSNCVWTVFFSFFFYEMSIVFQFLFSLPRIYLFICLGIFIYDYRLTSDPITT